MPRFPTRPQPLAVSEFANALQAAAVLAGYLQRCAAANTDDLTKLVAELHRAGRAAAALRDSLVVAPVEQEPR